MNDVVWFCIWVIDHWPEYSMLITIAISSNMDAVACVMKYLVAASVDRGLPLLISRGINASMLISKPAHIVSQWELVIVIIVPMIIVG